MFSESKRLSRYNTKSLSIIKKDIKGIFAYRNGKYLRYFAEYTLLFVVP